MIVIGLGNRFRQDDAVGLVVARRLRESMTVTAVIEHEGDPLDLLPVWSGHDLAILIDALNAPGEAGSIRCLGPDAAAPSRESVVTTHGHSLWDALELASVLGQLPESMLIFAVAGARFGYGDGLSPEVEQAIDEVVHRVGDIVVGSRCP